MKPWIFCVLYIAAAHSVEAQCPNGWVQNATSCYKFRIDTESWVEAMDVCALYGGYLVEIGDAVENAFVHELSNKDNVWLGGSDLSIEGEWVWITSRSDMTYINWRPSEPNNYKHDENCLEMDTNGLWIDDPCHNSNKYVCEKEFGASTSIG